MCRDLDDFEPSNIFSEWCVVSALTNATACASVGCEVRFGAEPDKYQCVCSGKEKCGGFGALTMQTTCGDEAAKAEIQAEFIAEIESGTCDDKTRGIDVGGWVRSRAARCCKSFPASVCEKDAEVAHPCKDANDFMPDRVMSRWCEFRDMQPNRTECIETGCKPYNDFCHCNSVTQCSNFGGVFREATCLAQGIHWFDYRKILSSVSATGTCANQTTPWGVDVGNFLQEQAESCCRSFPLSVCSEESTTTASAQKFITVQSPEAVAALLQEQETEVLDYLLSNSNATFSQIKLPGSNSVVLAQRLSTKALAKGNIHVAIASDAGQKAGVSVPAAILDSLPGGEDAVLVVSSLDVGLGLPVNTSGSDGVTNQVRAALSINLASATSGKYVHVEGLVDPIILTFPVNASAGIICAFWDEEESRWSQRGMQQDGGNASSLLTCSTTHLTLFAAIAGEIKKTIMCAQTMALSRQSLAALGVGNWFLRWDACMLWLLILLHAGLITAAFCSNGLFHWSDKQFLCCTGHHSHEVIFDRCAAPAGGMWSGCAALRTEWLIEVCGVTSHFLVNSCTTMCQFVAPEDGEQRTSMMRSLVSRLLAVSLQYQTSATLQMDIEDVQFVTMCRRKLLKRIGNQEMLDAWYAPQPAWEVPRENANAKQVHQFDCLAQRVGQHLDQHVWAVSCNNRAIWKLALVLLRSQMPWLAVFRFSIFMPASMRGLLLSCRLFGAMLVISIFFQTSGQALVVSSNQNCEEDPKGIVELLAQCLVIGLGSLIIARIPVCILARLRSRQFRFYESDNVSDMERQLRVWRYRDVLIWVFGLSYLAICILFLMTFLANIDAGDATEWKIAVSLELLSEFILVPSVVALFLLAVTKLTSKWAEAVREGAEGVGSTVAGEVDRPLAPTAAKVRLKTAMDKFSSSGSSVQLSGELKGSPPAAKLYLKALFDAFRFSTQSEEVHTCQVLPVWPPLPCQLPPMLPPVPQESRSNIGTVTQEPREYMLRCTSFCETSCNEV